MLKRAWIKEEVTVKEALRDAILELQHAHVETASLDARILLEYVLGLNREQLLLALDESMTHKQDATYRAVILKRCERQPLAQIIGRREFWGMNFKVTSDTLDPRPDSETLIETVLKAYSDRSVKLRILDLGIGTGCLLLSLLKEFPCAYGVGVDKSPAALAVAKENALALGFSSRADFTLSDWFEKIGEKFDVIISNPPYIATDDIASCPPEVARHEPYQALDGGGDGLSCYRTIFRELPGFLNEGGMACLEMGLGQQPALEALALQHGMQAKEAVRDLQGIPRCLWITH